MNAFLALWVMITPSVLDYQDRADLAITQGAVGFLLLGLAAYRLGKPRSPHWLSWANVALGLWLTVAPFLLLPSGTGDRAAYWNSGISGVLIALLGAASAVATRRGHATRRR